jgi:hypothetical protein
MKYNTESVEVGLLFEILHGTVSILLLQILGDGDVNFSGSRK